MPSLIDVNGHLIGDGPFPCTYCKLPVQPTDQRVPFKQVQDEKVGPSPTDPIIAWSHKTCHLENIIEQLKQQVSGASALAGAMLARCGGKVRLHKTDFERSLAVGHTMDVDQQEGGWFLVRLHSIIQIDPSQLPPNARKPS